MDPVETEVDCDGLSLMSDATVGRCNKFRSVQFLREEESLGILRQLKHKTISNDVVRDLRP